MATTSRAGEDGGEQALFAQGRPPGHALAGAEDASGLRQTRRNPQLNAARTAEWRTPSGPRVSTMAARTFVRIPSHPGGSRAPGSETLRAGSAAMLGLHPGSHGDEEPAGPWLPLAAERKGKRQAVQLASGGGSPQHSSSLSTTASLGDLGSGEPCSPSAKVRSRTEPDSLATYCDAYELPRASSSGAGESSRPHSSGGGGSLATTTLLNALTSLTQAADGQRPQLRHRPATGQSSHGSEGLEDPPVSPSLSGGERGSVGGLSRAAARRGGLAGRRKHLQLSVEIPVKKEIKQLNEEKIFDLYSWDEVLQEEGDGGKVVVCKPKATSDSTASLVMKIRSKESLRNQQHEEEFRKSVTRMLNFPPHIGVMPLREVYEDEKFYYAVMDRATGGSFFCSLLREFKDGSMPQEAVKGLMREILEAVGHVHKQGMLHRDIKPDNLVMQFYDDPCSPTGKVKKVVLIDFDHADPDWSPQSAKKDHACYGTLRFNAPETFQGEYCAGSDIYSVGAILYLLMSGKLPYEDALFENELDRAQASPTSSRKWMDAIYLHMKETPVDWSCSPWQELEDCRDFCQGLLAFDPRGRTASAEEALQHPWLQEP